jgi:hypothetical protein
MILLSGHENKPFYMYAALEQKILLCVQHQRRIDLQKTPDLKPVLLSLISLDYGLHGEPPLWIKLDMVYPTLYFPTQVPIGRTGQMAKSNPKNSVLIW